MKVTCKYGKNVLLLLVLIFIVCCTMCVAAAVEPLALTYESKVVVKGSLDESYADKDVTLMLVRKGVEPSSVTNSDIGYLDMCKIQSDGSYKFDFTFKGNTDDYQVKVNQANTDVTKSVTKAVTENQLFVAEVKLINNTFSVSSMVTIDNVFNLETDMNYTSIISFYSKENKLLDVKLSAPNEVGFGITTGLFESDVPDGTDKAKAFVWKNTEKIIPLCISSEEDIHPYGNYINHRTSLENTYKKLKNDKELKIVFLGGSVTFGTGSSDAELYSWRGRITSWLKTEFPEANITAYNAAIGGTGSKLGAYRLERDVLSQNPDLIFVTYAINDFYCGDSDDEIKTQYETIVNNILVQNPNADIIALHDIDKEKAREGLQYFRQAQQIETIADYYDIPSVNMGRALADSINVFNDVIWSEYFTDIVHPTDKGYAFYAEVVKEFFVEEFSKLYSSDITKPLVAKVMPENTYNSTLQTNIHYITVENIDFSNSTGWSLIHNQYARLYPYSLKSSTVNSEFEFSFQGTELGLYCYNSTNSDYPFEWSIDGGQYKTKVIPISPPEILERGLSNTNHVVKIRLKSNADISINAILYR